LIRAYQYTPLLEEVVAQLRQQSVPPEAVLIVDSSKDSAVTAQFAMLGDKVVPYPDEEFNFSKAINVGVAANDLPLTLVISSHVVLEDHDIVAKGWSEAHARGLEVVYWTNRETPHDVVIEIDPRSFTGRNGLFNSTALIPTHLIRERPFREEVFAAEDQEWTRYYLRRFQRPVLRIETMSVQYLNPNHSAVTWNDTKLLNEELAIGHYVNRRLIMPDRIAARVFRGILATVRRRPGRARMHFGMAEAMLLANFRPPSGRSRYFEED
jgi:glycosyltransferase involved in cell wall biosynthesis